MVENETLNAQSGTTTRREFIQTGLAAAGAAISPSLLQAQPVGKTKRPNLLFIFNEGQRADCMSIAGHPILQTPNMDRIGREGIRFTNGFCTNSLCAPARGTAMTGLWSRSNTSVDNKNLHTPFPDDIPLFTDYLLKAGYKTAVIGKVHARNGLQEKHWDYYLGFNAPATNYYNPKFAEGKGGAIGPEKVYPGVYADDFATDRLLDWLKQERTEPFCAMLWFQTPHAPFFRARRHLDLYRDVVIPKPETFDDDLKGYPGKPSPFVKADNKIGTTSTDDCARTLEEVAKDYYAGMVDVDENIGRIFKYLEESGQMDNTAVVHSSDHGYFLGEWRLFDKRLMHEPSIRVPMQIRFPERIKAGQVRDEMVLDVDIAPTILDLAGLPIPAHMQGESMLKLTNAQKPKWRQDWLYDYYEYPGFENVAPHRGVRTATHKYIEWYTQEPMEYELYDLSNDPGEQKNLYGDPAYAEIQNHLKQRLVQLLEEIPVRKA